MKRGAILSLLLISALLLSGISGCGSNSSDTGTKQASDNTQSSITIDSLTCKRTTEFQYSKEEGTTYADYLIEVSGTATASVGESLNIVYSDLRFVNLSDTFSTYGYPTFGGRLNLSEWAKDDGSITFRRHAGEPATTKWAGHLEFVWDSGESGIIIAEVHSDELIRNTARATKPITFPCNQ